MSLGTVLIKVGVAFAVGVAAYLGLQGYEDVRLTATTGVALAGTLTGFLLTALSMLVSVADRPFIANLRLTGHYTALVRSIISAAALWLAVAVVGLVGHVTTGVTQQVTIAIELGLASLAFIQFVTVGQRFTLVVELLAKP